MNPVKLLIITCLVVLLSTSSMAEVLFSEDFESQVDWVSGDGFPDPQYGGTTLFTTDDGGTTYYAGVISSSGRIGGQSLKLYRNGTTWTGNTYYGPSFGLRPWAITGLSTMQHMYMSWWMKVPTDWTFPVGQKMFRYNVHDAAGDKEFYVNFEPTGIRACPNSGGTDCLAADLVTNAVFKTGNWEHHELYVDYSTRTVTYWLNGVQTYHKVDFGSDANMLSRTTGVFGSSDNTQLLQHWPYGNSTTGSTHATGWKIMEFDDFVLSSTRVGYTETVSGGTKVGGGSTRVNTSTPMRITPIQ